MNENTDKNGLKIYNQKENKIYKTHHYINNTFL